MVEGRVMNEDDHEEKVVENYGEKMVCREALLRGDAV